MKPVRLRWGINENSLEKQSDRVTHDAGSSKVRKNLNSRSVSSGPRPELLDHQARIEALDSSPPATELLDKV